MVKSGSDRSAKTSAKYDPFVNMLRTKRLQNLAKFKFVMASNQQKLLDQELASWLAESSLTFGQRGYLFDLVKKLIWKWESFSDEDKHMYHNTWIDKGLPESLWLKLDAKFDEITSFTKTKNSKNIIVTFETDVFPYPAIDVNPVQTDYVKSHEVLPVPTEDYTQTPWRQKTVKYGSVDYKSFWSNTRMNKTIGLQTLIETVEPLKVDKNVQISTKLLDLLEALGCVAYLKFDEDSGNTAFDDTLNANNGILSGSLFPAWVTGIRGHALQLEGTSDYVWSYVDIPHSASFPFGGTHAFTVSLWVNCDSGYVYYCPFCTSDLVLYCGIAIRLEVLGIQGGLALDYPANMFNEPLFGSTSLIGNGWHHIVLTYDGTHFKGYVDGIYKQSFAWNKGIEGGFDVFLGKWWGPSFHGLVDEFHIFNRALSNDEISVLFFTEAHKTANISTSHDSESGLHKSKSKTISIGTSEGNTVLASPSETSNINTTYETEVT
jgi:hypothetical protein